MQPIILIDGDILVYQAAFSVEVPIYVCHGKCYNSRNKALAYNKDKGPDVEIVKRKNIGSEKQVRAKLKSKIDQMFLDLGTRNYKMFLTETGIENNFRTALATLKPYKGNRLIAEKPFHYHAARKILVNEYKAILVKGQEADDAIGIEQGNIKRREGHVEQSIIASIDKDLRMIEGFHYNLTTRILDYVTEDEGLKNFYGQILSGDATDNIPGLGQVLRLQGRAEEADKLKYVRPGYLAEYVKLKVEHSPEYCYAHVKGLYDKYKIEDKDFLEIGRLLWMRREENQLWELRDEESLQTMGSPEVLPVS